MLRAALGDGRVISPAPTATIGAVAAVDAITIARTNPTLLR
jgi:hypothetical protein